MERVVDVMSLKHIMIDKNIETATELAEVSGVSRCTISGVLNGKINPSADVMLSIANALEMKPEQAGSIFFALKLT